MNAWEIQSHGSVEGLIPTERAALSLAHSRSILVRVRAVSLNYRDVTALRTARPGNLSPLVPCSDGAGEVIAVGKDVTKWKAGDRVAGCFFQDWVDGPIARETMASAQGGPIHGVLAEEACWHEDGAVAVPGHLSHEEAACLPCAGVTAWHALMEKGGLAAGQTVLVLGTGGVSVFALQFAKACGARVIVTSSSDEKLARARALGADETINYRATPEWEREVYALTDKTGVDHVIEVGGAGTLEKSLAAVRFGGRISLIGVLSGFEGTVNPWPIVARSVAVQGIYVGSTRMFEAMNRFVASHALRPMIDRVFPFAQAREAFSHLENGRHFGKVVIAL